MVLFATGLMTIPNKVVSQGVGQPLKQSELWEDGLMVANMESATIALENWKTEQERIKNEALIRRVRYIPTTVITIQDHYDGYTKKELSNCWNFVRDDIIIGVGNAKNHPAPLKNPEIGFIMISYESSRGHYSRVLAVFENEFVIGEFNYISGYYTERIIKKNDPRIKGFYNPNK